MTLVNVSKRSATLFNLFQSGHSFFIKKFYLALELANSFNEVKLSNDKNFMITIF